MKCCIYSGLILLQLSVLACAQSAEKKKHKPVETQLSQASLPYNLSAPQVFEMPKVLNEISGITFRNGDTTLIYAEQDEEGKVFAVNLATGSIAETKFGKKGDFEDVQILGDQVIMLRSDGTLFTFAVSALSAGKVPDAKELSGLLPGGEYEGMYANNREQKLYILCKHCDESLHKTNTAYVLALDKDGALKQESNFTINVEDIATKAGVGKVNFQPSALAKNEHTNEWYILSSVNKLLVILNANRQVKEVYRLDEALFNQPEGIAFDPDGNLYISNEKGNTKSATLLKFAVKK